MMARTGMPPAASLNMESPLWQFALSLWRITDAERACLALQAQGWSVTRILCACWLASLGKTYPGDSPSVSHWRESVTQHLRDLRQAMPKDNVTLTALRTRLAAAELEAERIELALAYDAVSPITEQESDKQPLSPELLRRNIHSAAPDTNMINGETEHAIDSLTRLLVNLQPSNREFSL
ncbi:TIGR02444 family protein [Marinobacter caseinilyticus]|uniref:TIGR02444 family protein n=1 Tax=Marinobacter caseinilyticus TaxID=2692195 RepID=UPI00140AC850|nr:TIGR02444 family protein [Marinobacter caseinilyticus]